MSVPEPIVHVCDNPECEQVIHQLYGTDYYGMAWSVKSKRYGDWEFCSLHCLRLGIEIRTGGRDER